ncbi:hypothetical protein LJC48_01255 [Desulfovibrio sp. OttesenSCG-928-C06]|nr:hypothetical protein [Desulfovibrio sp. OttesenSCG-928-C06]
MSEPIKQEQPTSGRLFRNRAEAIRFLKGLGYRFEQTKFYRDAKSGKVYTNADGMFEETVLRSYANLELTPAEQMSRQDAVDRAIDKTAADARLKNIQADRFALKLAREQGKLIRREEYEAALAARAIFFQREIINFIHLHGGAIIHLVSGDESKLPHLTAYYREHTAVWMDAWSHEREFVVSSDLDEAPDTDDEDGDAAPEGSYDA